MVLPVTHYKDNPQVPGISAYDYLPDQLVVGNVDIPTMTIVVASSAALLRGSVMGQVTATGKWKLAASAAGDGSQTPLGILVDDVDASAADAAGAVYVGGEFNGRSLILGVGTTLAAATTAFLNNGLVIKTTISAADPL